jgi:hypothetical protein
MEIRMENVQKQEYAEPTLQKRQQLLEITEGAAVASVGGTDQEG